MMNGVATAMVEVIHLRTSFRPSLADIGHLQGGCLSPIVISPCIPTCVSSEATRVSREAMRLIAKRGGVA